MAAHSEANQDASVQREGEPLFSRSRVLLLAAAAPIVIIGVAVFALNRHTVTAEPLPKSAPARIDAQHAAARPIPGAQTIEAAAQPALPPPQVLVGSPTVPTPAQIASAGSIDQLAARAKTGDVTAERDLGLKYLAGDGISADESQAAGWLMRSAYTGDAEAEYWLGTLYSRGHGVPADASQANHWYEAAAKQGNARAMHSLAVANFEGWGTAKNVEEAARWFTKAAEMGLVDSQFDLAVLYERGAGVTQSNTNAYKWYVIAARSGDKEAAARVAVLAKTLKSAELAQAQEAAASFHASPAAQTADAAKP
jgi:localization factor PodJL